MANRLILGQGGILLRAGLVTIGREAKEFLADREPPATTGIKPKALIIPANASEVRQA
jgi:hypothetical protein